MKKFKFRLRYGNQVFTSDPHGSDSLSIGIYTRDGYPVSHQQLKFSLGQDSENDQALPKIISSKFHDDRFTHDYSRVQQSIETHQLEKGVVFNTLEITFDRDLNHKDFYPQALINQDLPNYFVLWEGEEGLVSLSPENLFSVREGVFSMDAIAGTDRDKENLLHNKYQNEQKLVIEDIQAKLESLNIQSSLSPQAIISFKDYFHLKNEFFFETSLEEEKIIQQMAPTAAIGGYPSKNFSQLKSDLKFENIPEAQSYAGIFHFKSTQFNFARVGIRSLHWKKNQVLIHAGCGIVKDSNLKNELSESHMKINSVLRSFIHEVT